MRIRIKYLLVCSCIIISVTALSYGRLSEPESANQMIDNRFVNAEIINLYNDLIESRQKALEENKKLIEVGLGNISDLIELEIKAADARIQLARFQNEKDLELQELNKLIKTITNLRETLKMEVEIGQRAKSDIYEIESMLLEIKIRAAKVTYDYYKPTDTKTNNTSENQTETTADKDNENIWIVKTGVPREEIEPVLKIIFEEYEKQNEDEKCYELIRFENFDPIEVTDSLHILLGELDVNFMDKVTIVPLPECKALLIYGDKEYCENIVKLTKESTPLNSQLLRKTFQLKYAEPQDLKNKIDEVFGNGNISSDSDNQPASADIVITTAYPSLKQIVVLASEEMMKIIEKQIREWDSPVMFD